MKIALLVLAAFIIGYLVPAFTILAATRKLIEATILAQKGKYKYPKTLRFFFIIALIPGANTVIFAFIASIMGIGYIAGIILSTAIVTLKNFMYIKLNINKATRDL